MLDVSQAHIFKRFDFQKVWVYVRFYTGDCSVLCSLKNGTHAYIGVYICIYTELHTWESNFMLPGANISTCVFCVHISHDTYLHNTYTLNKHMALLIAQRCYFPYNGHYLPRCIECLPQTLWLLCISVAANLSHQAEDGHRAILTDGSDSQETTYVHPVWVRPMGSFARATETAVCFGCTYSKEKDVGLHYSTGLPEHRDWSGSVTCIKKNPFKELQIKRHPLRKSEAALWHSTPLRLPSGRPSRTRPDKLIRLNTSPRQGCRNLLRRLSSCPRGT